jgi:phosphatidylglycerol:prolipoprotein diacylglycerol transferase
MHPVLVSIGPVHIYSLSLFLILAWVVFSFVFWRQLREQAVEEERIFDLSFYATLVALISARLGFVITHQELFSDGLLKIAALWVQPGLSIYGALIGGCITLLYIARKYKVRVAYILDSLAFSLPLALIIGAIGSFLDGSVVGKLTDVPWGVSYLGYPGKRHPVQLYEAVYLVCLLAFLVFIQKKAAKRGWPYGVSGLLFFALFAIGMFTIEFVKEASVYFSSLSANQWVLVAIFAEALGAFYVRGGGRELVFLIGKHVRLKLASAFQMLYAKFPKKPSH